MVHVGQIEHEQTEVPTTMFVDNKGRKRFIKTRKAITQISQLQTIRHNHISAVRNTFDQTHLIQHRASIKDINLPDHTNDNVAF